MKGMKGMKGLEWAGAFVAVVYAQLIAFNIGAEVLGFVLLLVSALLLGVWAYLGRHRGLLLLQVFYAITAVIGIVRWL